jgi:hypothetical protein
MQADRRPRYRHLPIAAQGVHHAGQEIVDLAAMAGLYLDPWQTQTLKDSMVRSDIPVWNPYTEEWEYKWAAREVGIMVSRQNGKGSILEARELAALFLFHERLTIHSAHQFDTSREAFERLLALVQETPELDAQVLRTPRNHGEEGIELKPPKGSKITGRGPRISFRTRTGEGGRGFTGDVIIIDEAMYFNSQQARALKPTRIARHNPQIWYTGSAGTRTSTEFGRIRARGINSSSEEMPHLFYVEWSADIYKQSCPIGCDDHDDPNDLLTWIKANPGLGIRFDIDGIESDYEDMDPADFAAEHLGVGDWPIDGTGWLLCAKEMWDARKDETSRPEAPFAIALDVSPDRGMSCIAVCGMTEDDKHHVEITGNEKWSKEHGYDKNFYDYRPGTGWVFDRVMDIWNNQKPGVLVIDKANQAGSFVDQFTQAGVKVVHPQAREYAQACGEFLTGVVPPVGDPPTVTHLGQKPLTDALKNADKRDLLDLWAFSKAKSYGDITPLVAATLAMWGYKTHVYRKKAATPWVVRR